MPPGRATVPNSTGFQVLNGYGGVSEKKKLLLFGAEAFTCDVGGGNAMFIQVLYIYIYIYRIKPRGPSTYQTGRSVFPTETDRKYGLCTRSPLRDS
ncbi:hypothetical protein LY78DRAFT_317083 [Colletotrichum sublineola]|nr:hypothetical protein LY78DRAFT_317083 [Colletotrichum sublineola]